MSARKGQARPAARRMDGDEVRKRLQQVLARLQARRAIERVRALQGVPLGLSAQVQVDVYECVARAVETGVAHGYARARRVRGRSGAAENAIYRSVMDELAQVLRLGVAKEKG